MGRARVLLGSLALAGRTGPAIVVATLHELRRVGLAPGRASFALTVASVLARCVTAIALCAGGDTVASRGCVVAIAVRFLGLAGGTIVTPVLATTFGRAMFAGRTFG